MSQRNVLAAIVAAVCSIGMIAAGASFRNAQPNAMPQSTDHEIDDRPISTRKGDRLPMAAPMQPAVTTAQSEVTTSPPEQLPPATEGDLRQAEEEHHRHRDMCPHGRTWFTIDRHRYWRCKV